MDDTILILESIRARLEQSPGEPVPAIVNALVPQSRAEAARWVRRLPLYEEFAGAYGLQVVGVARTIAKRALRESGLRLTDEGRVVEDRGIARATPNSQPTRTFLVPVNGEEVKCEYTCRYSAGGDYDLFEFLCPDYVRPPPGVCRLPGSSRPHALSLTGFRGQFAPHDAVEACGGPEAYAAQFASALLGGHDKAFTAALEGRRPEPQGRKRRPKHPVARKADEMEERGVVGEHTARLAESQESPAPELDEDRPGQPSLF